MKYLLLDENFRVKEIFYEEDSTFPGVPLSERYSKDLLDTLIGVENSILVEQGYALNKETGEWEYVDPPIYEPTEKEIRRATLEEKVASLEFENIHLKAQLAETDEVAIDLYEASLAQETINAEQDEAIIEIYEMMEGITNG
jgi:hypothetical protein